MAARIKDQEGLVRNIMRWKEMDLRDSFYFIKLTSGIGGGADLEDSKVSVLGSC